MLELKTDEKVNAANERLKNIYETLCCYCIENKKLSVNHSNESSFIKFQKIEIYNKVTKQIDTENINTHLICSNCIEKHKMEIEEKKEKEKQLNNLKNDNNNKINEEKNKTLRNQNNGIIEVEFFCRICDKKHLTNLKTDENRQNKKACCAGCSIF